MIGYLQTRGALAAASDGRAEIARVRLDRAARQVVRYLEDLQLKEGRAAGLFYHAPDAPQVWGRGNGWAAAGITVALVSRLDGDANLADVCVGTDIGKTEKHYLGRGKVTGAPHGQAGLLLCVNALLVE